MVVSCSDGHIPEEVARSTGGRPMRANQQQLSGLARACMNFVDGVTNPESPGFEIPDDNYSPTTSLFDKG